MLKSLLSAHEEARLKAVKCLEYPFGRVHDADPDLTSLVEAAALVCGTPISLVTLVGEDMQWFKAQVGLEGVHETSREVSFCAHTILEDQVFEIVDVMSDPRFAANPLVTGAPDIRFYAGAPLTTHNGQNVGALCVIDTKPRQLTDDQRRILLHLSKVASHILESNRAAWQHSLIAAELKALNDSAPFGLYAADALGKCTQVNPKWLEIYGRAEAESLGDGWWRGMHPEDRVRVEQAWSKTVAMGSDFDQEFRVLRPDGSARIVRSVARQMAGEDGRVIGIVGSIEDVTQVRDQSLRLEEKRQRLSLIVESTGVATFEWNVQTGELRVGPQWFTLTGHDSFPISSFKDAVDNIHPNDIERVMHAAQTDLMESGFLKIEFRRKHKLGHWIWVDLRCKLVTWTADGKPELTYGIQFDVTERKKAEERMRRSERLLSKTGEAAGVGGWELDLETMELTWTDETRRLHAVPEDFTPDVATAIDFYAPASRPLIVAAVEAAIATGLAYDLELQILRADGSLIWVRSLGSVETKDGKPVRLYGAFQDISDRVARQNDLIAEHQRMVLATESNGIGVWELDLASNELTWDSQMLRNFGHTAGYVATDVSGIWQRALLPEDRAAVDTAVDAAVSENRRFESEFRITWPDGSERYIRSLADVVVNPRTGAKILLGVNWDITQLRSLTAELAAQHALMRVTLRSIGDAVITTDKHTVITWLNPVAEAMTGWALHEAIGRPIKQVFHILNEVTLKSAQDPVEKALKEQRVVALSSGTILISRTGQQYGIEDSAAPIRDDANQIQGVVLVFHDVTNERRLTGEMAYRATHDSLTGIKNRSEFEIRLAQLRQQAQSGEAEHSMLFIDLDHFKLINDSCGHTAGDEVLQQVSKIFADNIRSRDTLARIGGDEFAILLEFCPPDRAAQIGKQICDQMEVYRYSHDNRRFRVGTSIGVVAIDQKWNSTEAIIQAADAACFAAKKSGRNRVRVWQDLDSSEIDRSAEVGWASRLEQALDADHFRLFVQEIRSLDPSQTGRHGEILLRLEEPDGTFSLPGQFLPAAERFDLMGQIDRWVLRHAIQALRLHPATAELRSISLNISGRSLADRAFHLHALAALSDAGPNLCQRLVLEITETSAVDNLVGASLFIEQLHALGVRVSLDDFGAGTASFGYLRALKVDCLKIDGQFVQGLLNDPLSQVTVRCFTEVAQVLGIPTVAEYVDHPDILAALKPLGVTFAQGFLISQPIPIDDFLNEGVRETPEPRMV